MLKKSDTSLTQEELQFIKSLRIESIDLNGSTERAFTLLNQAQTAGTKSKITTKIDDHLYKIGISAVCGTNEKTSPFFTGDNITKLDSTTIKKFEGAIVYAAKMSEFDKFSTRNRIKSKDIFDLAPLLLKLKKWGALAVRTEHNRKFNQITLN